MLKADLLMAEDNTSTDVASESSDLFHYIEKPKNSSVWPNKDRLGEVKNVENNNNHLMRRNRHLSLEEDDERFVHVNTWHTDYGGNPCSKTETIYLFAFRSEEPVVTNMDISTGHIVLVSVCVWARLIADCTFG